MKEVATLKVWSNGKLVRRYQGQDIIYEKRGSRYGRKTSPSKGFRVMVCKLYEAEE